MRITQPKSYRFLSVITALSIGVLLYMFRNFPSSMTPSQLLTSFSILVTLSTLAILIELKNRARTIEIDMQNKKIFVHRKTWLFSRRTDVYKASSFSYVVSYATRSNFNCIELIQENKVNGLLLASFSSISGFKFSSKEPIEVETLRNSVATTCGYQNGGFLGYRDGFHQLAPNEKAIH